MDLTGEYRIPASREKVWAALNDDESPYFLEAMDGRTVKPKKYKLKKKKNVPKPGGLRCEPQATGGSGRPEECGWI